MCIHLSVCVAAYSLLADPGQQCGLAARTCDHVLFSGEGDETA